MKPGQFVISPRPATVDVTDRVSASPLWKAAETGNIAKFTEVLNANDVVVASQAKIALLHIACKKGHKDVVVCLLKKYPELVNMRQTDEPAEGLSALHIAASGGHVRVIRALLEFKADVNVVNDHGKSPIALAKTRGISRLLAAKDLEHAAKSREIPHRLIDYCLIVRETTTWVHAPSPKRGQSPQEVVKSMVKTKGEILSRWPTTAHPDFALEDIHPLQLLRFMTCNNEDEDDDEADDCADDFSSDDNESKASASHRRHRLDLDGGSAQSQARRRRHRTRRKRSARVSALTNDARRIFWCGVRLDEPIRETLSTVSVLATAKERNNIVSPHCSDPQTRSLVTVVLLLCSSLLPTVVRTTAQLPHRRRLYRQPNLGHGPQQPTTLLSCHIGMSKCTACVDLMLS